MKGFLDSITHRPLEVIELLCAMAFIIGGLWILSPLYNPMGSTGATLVGEDINKILAVWQLLISVPLLVSFFKDSQYRLRIRFRSTFLMFTTGLFYATGIFLGVGFDSTRWNTILIIALICGVLHLRLKWELT